MKRVLHYWIPTNGLVVSYRLAPGCDPVHVAWVGASLGFWAEDNTAVSYTVRTTRYFFAVNSGDAIPDTARYWGTVVKEDHSVDAVHLYELIGSRPDGPNADYHSTVPDPSVQG